MPPLLPVLRQLILFSLILGLTGCSVPRFAQPTTAKLACAKHWDVMEQQLEQRQLQDVASRRLPGFPYLRSNRFYSALATRLTQPDQQQALAQQLRQLDLDARQHELQRLSESQRRQLAYQWGLETDADLWPQINRCSAQLLQHDLSQHDFSRRLLTALPIADNYSGWRRLIGLYPLFVWPVDALAHQAHQSIQQRLQRFEEPANNRSWTSYHPAAPPQPHLTAASLATVLSESRDNLLATYQLNVPQLARLAHHYAPQLRLAGDTRNDRIGRVIIDHDELVVDTGQPTVYYYASHALLHGQPTLQLNYVFWYPGRYADEVSWIERGRLDGVTLRYTLDADGQPMMIDLINNCGCYHGFLPSPDHFELQRLKQPHIAAQVLQPLPTTGRDGRLGFTFNRHHQLVQAQATSAGAACTYQLRPYQELEQLPTAQGPARSLFDQRGVVPASRRVESALLFSMGIASVGSMRQRGNQPTTLVGREHFDNPSLFDELFFYRPPITKPTAPAKGGRP